MTTQPLRVLLVEDSLADARLVHEYLNEEDAGRFVLIHAAQLDEALSIANRQLIDVVLLDLTLPDSEGLSSLSRLQHAHPALPIVVLSGLADQELALEAVSEGAQDYLVKGQGYGALLSRALHYAIERKTNEKRLAYLAYHDPLTGLANRSLLQTHLRRALSRARRTGRMLALMLLDLDHFKHINDSLGHDAGDQLLKIVANRLKLCIRQEDTVARFGGDEFTLILENLNHPEDAATIAQKILSTLSRRVTLLGNELHITPSIGISLYPESGDDPDSLLKETDIALYWVKEQGRCNYAFYQPKMGSRAEVRLNLESKLSRALENGEFQLYYQPQVHPQSGRVTGLEALLRWQHPEQGIIAPGAFIHLAEETGLIVPIGEWVLRTACMQAKAWQDQGLLPVPVGVNLSVKQCLRSGLIERIDQILAETGLESSRLELEITESLLTEDLERATVVLRALQARNIIITLDDFGIGYSSLKHLKKFPLNRLKIPQTFVRDVPTDPRGVAIVLSIIALAHNLNLHVIAEGVENEIQLAFLQAKHCDVLQGYYFSRPLPAEKVSDLIAADKPFQSVITSAS